MNSIEGKILGRTVDYPQQYQPQILVAVPRHFNREQYDLKAERLPFIGLDVWHAYEFSFLTIKGLPVSGLLKMAYTCSNEAIVESKSLKLYLNSFNMERIGNSVEEGITSVLSIIKKDIDKLLNTSIELHFHQKEDTQFFDFDNYQVLEDLEAVKNISFDNFNENPALLQGTPKTDGQVLKLSSHLLRSNCKVTHQPDWGSIYIHIESQYEINKEALLAYIISFRNENHFHEEICEMAYKRLWDAFAPVKLAVSCLYTRRGGIDICPTRSSHPECLPTTLCQADKLTTKLLRQ